MLFFTYSFINNTYLYQLVFCYREVVPHDHVLKGDLHFEIPYHLRSNHSYVWISSPLLTSLFSRFLTTIACGSDLISWRKETGFGCDLSMRCSLICPRHFPFSHIFTSVWILSCFWRLPESLNALSHLEQQNGFSLLWILSCVFNWLDVLNLFSHFEQLNGFSPVWILSWVFNW